MIFLYNENMINVFTFIFIIVLRQGISMEKKKIAQYKQIEHDLTDKIIMGFYKKDDLIPTEMELSKMYGVSRVTIRKATDNMVAKGYLYRTSGVGTFVKQVSVTSKVTSLRGFTDEITDLGMVPRSEVDAFSLQKVPRHIANILNLNEGDMVFYIKRKRFADDELFVIETTWMSADLYPDMSIQVLQGSKYHFFEDTKKLKIAYSYHVVTPIHPPAQIAELFGIDQDTPIIKVGNTTYLENGQIMDYSELVLNSPKYQLRYIKQ